ncbi:MAG: dihydrolipoyl dehydrogenase [Chloroflexi bacterium]|nr:dihydrolipoyl dehydrogenase [Chloroflexota bacterium]MBT4514305.1 dihydrolipoyl dehydrogenase [Chloroflexota bacterium]MBT6681342.1 dihydrolipoyl dehydrogenase [Chloroflexota bacterium]
MKNYDLLIIGSGSAGIIPDAAINRGETVAVVEPKHWGGTCVNVGCIPTKMLIAAAEAADAVNHGDFYGLKAHIDHVDWDRVVGRVKDKLSPMWGGISDWYHDYDGLTPYDGYARFVSDRVVEVNGEQITGDKIIINAGARPFVPPIPGIDSVPFLTSDEALYMETQPKSMVVIGGGYIGAELGHYFSALGTELTVIDMAPEMLMIEDHEVRARFTESFKSRANTRVILGASVKSVGGDDNSVSVTIEVDGKEQVVSAEKLLVATGRRPNTDTLNMMGTSINCDTIQRITVNEYMETNVENVWALGDVADTPPLKHVANMEARIVRHNLWAPKNERMQADYHGVPHAVFSSPQVGSVGETEDTLKDHGIPYTAVNRSYGSTAWGWALGDDDSFAKLLVGEDRKILGAHIIGPSASILIQEFATPMRLGLTVDEMKEAIYTHPAASELVENAFLDA